MNQPPIHISLPVIQWPSGLGFPLLEEKLLSIKKVVGLSIHQKQQTIELQLAEEEVLVKVFAILKEEKIAIASSVKSFPVLGMSCAACANSAENIIKYQLGVLDASVNYGTGALKVEYLPNYTNPLSLKKALQNAAYDLLIEEQEEQQQTTLENLQLKALKKLRNSTLLACLFTLPVVLFGMVWMHAPYANLIMWLFTTPVVLYFGKDFFLNAFKQAQHFKANMDTLVALSTGIAYGFSAFNMVYGELWQGHTTHEAIYFESAAVVISFILLGRYLEAKAKQGTSSALKKLMGLQPKEVEVILPNGSQTLKRIDEVQIGDVLLAKPGASIAVDGVLIQGSSFVDESMLTGEPLPAQKTIESKVYAGTINQKGSFEYRALKVGKATMLSQIIASVQEAQGSKAPVQKLVDKIAGIFVPIVIGIALLSFLLWWLLGAEQGIRQGLLSAITVLVVACPCALGLATPTAIMVGMGRAAGQGILIKDAESLELATQVSDIVLDKTGTITQGKPSFSAIKWASTVEDTSKLSSIMVAMEKLSEHPLAEALVSGLSSSVNIDKAININQFESITGRGVQAFYEQRPFYLGNKEFLQDKGLQNFELALLNQAELWQEMALTVVWFASEDKVLACISVGDALKPTSQKAVSELQAMGKTVHLLTGDNLPTARAIAKQAGIQHYKAQMLPQDKAEYIKNLQQVGKKVAMVGDGINDSAALATANVSIAMGKGSDIAKELAKITIVSSDLLKIPKALHISAFTVATIKENLFWAFIYNLLGIPIAAGLLYPINGFVINPMIAGAAMVLSSLSVLANSLRLKWRSK